MDKLQLYKKEIDAFLASFLASKEKIYAQVNGCGPDAIEKIRSIVYGGKTIRGALVLYIHDALKGKRRNDALKTAAAYELMQTALVVHDDIMDHDEMRRGKPTLHVQYHNEGMAMCVGDILFFMAHELMDGTGISEMSARIYQQVGIAQMQDVSFGLSDTVPPQKEILDLYKFKTARYSFSLPMMAGAVLAGADKKTVSQFEKLGEDLGIIFQIQNDTLNVKGDTREHKKTLARFYPVQKILSSYSYDAQKNLAQLNTHIDTTLLFRLLHYVAADVH